MSSMLLGILNSQAAGGGAPYELLETTTSGGSSITFSGLGSYSNYAHLQFRFVTKSTNSLTSNTDMLVKFDNSTSSDYASHLLNGYGSGTQSGAFVGNRDGISIIDCLPGTNANSGFFGSGIIDILDWSNPSKNTTLRALSGSVQSADADITLTSGAMFKTQAIASVTFQPEGFNNFVSGTRFSLYGIRA